MVTASTEQIAHSRRSKWKPYAYGWVTGGFFLVSLLGHWVFGWFAYVDEQRQHDQPIQPSGYVVEMTRDTLENWQSEFLQLLWQVGGLALLLYVGSPQSKEGTDRMEAKLDAVLRSVDREQAERIIAEIDEAYSGRPPTFHTATARPLYPFAVSR